MYGMPGLIFIVYTFSAGAQTRGVKPTPFDGLQIRASHPRIWVDADKRAWLKQKCKGKTAEEVQQLAGPSIIGTALTYLITGDKKIGREAIDRALDRYVYAGNKSIVLFDGESKHPHTQANLTDKALVYDWCYPLLAPADKAALKNFILAGIQKHIAFKRGWRSFHNGMYSIAWPTVAGTLALYGDEPYAQEAWAFLKPELADVLKTFDNVFPDGEWAEGFDYNRHSTYPALRIFLAIKSATGGNFIASSIHMKNTGKYIIYSSKPNGYNLPGDDNDWPYIGPWENSALLMLNEVFKDGYNQNFLNNCPAERFKLEPYGLYQHLLWYNPAIKEKPLEELPLSRMFKGKGLVLARSNWQWDAPGKPANATWLSFHCGDYLGDHAHYDINSFTISHNGELALDAGRYDDDWGAEDWNYQKDTTLIGKSQFFNYYKRTIAHNTILVKDPNEKMALHVLNDGGQIDQLRRFGPRNVPEDYDQGNFPSEDGVATCDWATNPGRWETGDITAYKATGSYMYVRGDGTKAYEASKMQSFIRQLVFLQPDVVVVMDRVVAVNPAFKKTWLLHTVNQPTIDEASHTVSVDEDNGRLVCVTVLPHNVTINKIGGPGNEFLVDTAHFQCGLKSVIYPEELHYAETPGAWRIEESPATAASEDYFLNVIQVGDKGAKQNPVVEVLSEDDTQITIRITVQGGTVSQLKFTKGKKPSTTIKIIKNNKVVADEKLG